MPHLHDAITNRPEGASSYYTYKPQTQRDDAAYTPVSTAGGSGGGCLAAGAGGVAGGGAEGGSSGVRVAPARGTAGSRICCARLLLQLLVLENGPVEHVVPLVACISKASSRVYNWQTANYQHYML